MEKDTKVLIAIVVAIILIIKFGPSLGLFTIIGGYEVYAINDPQATISIQDNNIIFYVTTRSGAGLDRWDGSPHSIRVLSYLDGKDIVCVLEPYTEATDPNWINDNYTPVKCTIKDAPSGTHKAKLLYQRYDGRNYNITGDNQAICVDNKFTWSCPYGGTPLPPSYGLIYPCGDDRYTGAKCGKLEDTWTTTAEIEQTITIIGVESKEKIIKLTMKNTGANKLYNINLLQEGTTPTELYNAFSLLKKFELIPGEQATFFANLDVSQFSGSIPLQMRFDASYDVAGKTYLLDKFTDPLVINFTEG